MFTVIIPTMWKFPPFINFLKTLTNYNLVGEILLFNNDYENEPLELQKINSEKLKIFNFGINIGPNEAWNIGAEKAQFDNLCILNDDVIFDLSLLDKLIPFLGKKDTGIMGLHPGEKDFQQKEFTNGNIDIIPWSNEHTYGFGCLMFLNKRNYFKIPKELFLYFGDNYLFDANLNNKKINYLITNLVHFTPFAVTTSVIKENRLEEEEKFYNLFYPEALKVLGIYNGECDVVLNMIESDIRFVLPILQKYALKSKSVLELGVRTGISTRILLNSNLNKLTSVDLVENSNVRYLFDLAKLIYKDYQYIINDSLQYCDNYKYDMLFIDTDHSHEQLSAELERYHQNINKYIICHDIVTYGFILQNLPPLGLASAIFEFLIAHPEWKVADFSIYSNGLIVLEKIGNE